PELAMTRSVQSYHRTAEDTYLFRNVESGFEALLRVDADGLVTDYPGGWTLSTPNPGHLNSAVS
ncbi:MAG: putative glycolipid-binding domain-containing protein, partial [Anaerolineales bacterium]